LENLEPDAPTPWRKVPIFGSLQAAADSSFEQLYGPIQQPGTCSEVRAHFKDLYSFTPVALREVMDVFVNLAQTKMEHYEATTDDDAKDDLGLEIMNLYSSALHFVTAFLPTPLQAQPLHVWPSHMKSRFEPLAGPVLASLGGFTTKLTRSPALPSTRRTSWYCTLATLEANDPHADLFRYDPEKELFTKIPVETVEQFRQYLTEKWLKAAEEKDEDTQVEMVEELSRPFTTLARIDKCGAFGVTPYPKGYTGNWVWLE